MNKYKKSLSSKRFFGCLLMVLVLSGCGGIGKTMVIAPMTERIKVSSSIGIVEGKSMIQVPEEYKYKFKNRLNKLLFENRKFNKGSDVIVEYTFVHYDEGNKFLRWFVGFGSGKGEIIVNVKYKKATGKDISDIRVEGQVTGGVFGGSFDIAIVKAAEQITKYTEAHF